MKLIKLLLVLTLAHFLAGCATTFIQAGKSKRDLNHDYVECEVKRGQARTTNWDKDAFMERCMASMGWNEE